MSLFFGYYRQRRIGFGALAADIGRVALPLARKFILPVAKNIGRELSVQCAPELVEIARKRKPIKQALRSTVAKTARKQIGGSRYSRKTQGRQAIRRQRQHFATLRTYKTRSTKNSFLENPSEEGVDLIFPLELEMRTYIVIPSEATHSSFDLFEKPLLLLTFDQSFEQKTGPFYLPSGSSLEFKVVGDCNSFIDLQKI